MLSRVCVCAVITIIIIIMPVVGTLEFWNIWTSILSLTILTYLFLIHGTFDQPSISIFIACIVCQLCSTIYHTFCYLSPIIYNLDLAGICCMSIGSPYLYTIAFGTDGLEVYTAVLVSLVALCFILIAKDTICFEVATCEHWIMVLFVFGNYPAIKLPEAQAAVAIIVSAYVLFRCLHLPECILSSTTTTTAAGKIWHSHVLWHCAVLASQLCYVSLVQTIGVY